MKINNIFSAPDDSFKNALLISLSVHGFLFSFLFLKAVFFESEILDYTAAVRVDIVGLPEKMTEPISSVDSPQNPIKDSKVEIKKEAESAPPFKPDLPPKEKEAVSLEKNKTKQADALRKLKAQSAIEKLQEEMALAKQNNKPEQDKSSAYKGNIVSPGTALTGLQKLQHDGYIARIDQHIKQNWALPQWLVELDLRAQVRVRINEKGELVSKQIVLSSGNTAYDEEALQTIDRSVPFPKPPEKFVALLEVNGFIVAFPD